MKGIMTMDEKRLWKYYQRDIRDAARKALGWGVKFKYKHEAQYHRVTIFVPSSTCQAEFCYGRPTMSDLRDAVVVDLEKANG